MCRVLYTTQRCVVPFVLVSVPTSCPPPCTVPTPTVDRSDVRYCTPLSHRPHRTSPAVTRLAWDPPLTSGVEVGPRPNGALVPPDRGAEGGKREDHRNLPSPEGLKSF